MIPVSRDAILTRFCSVLSAFDSKIQAVYLFGSRAKGTERPDSDYDILLVVSESFSFPDKDKIYDAVMDVLLETGRLISLKIFKKAVFDRLSSMETPFMRHIHRQGVLIG